MKKVSSVIRLVLLFICVILIFSIRSRNNEGFYDSIGSLSGPGIGMYTGTYDDPNLYPLAYNMYQSKPMGPQAPDMGPLGTQRIPVSVPYVPAPAAPAACTGQSAGTGMYQHPLTYPNQLYPKVPWYPKTGSSCVPGECGAASTCYEGYCVPNKTDKTVFNTDIR